MSRVFLAEELSLGRKVVIKTLPDDLAATVSMERFRREIQLAARLQHPHIVPVLTAGSIDGVPYYTMPFIEGQSLRALLVRDGALPVETARKYLADILSALAHAHEHGVVHRDIKPENILITGRHAVVTDFGVAKAVTAATNDVGLTDVGVAVGTLAYMAPEQAVADPATDHRADLYAAGALAYEMLSGQALFAGRSKKELLHARITQTPESIGRVRDSVPPVLADVIMRALATDPADRPRSAREMLAVVETDAGARPTGSRLRHVGVIAAAVVVLVVAGIATVTLRGRRAPPAAAHTAIAVLPFENLTGDAAEQNFVDAMHDALIAQLAQIRALTVRSRQSTLRFRGSDRSIPEIAAALDVDDVVQGSVFRAGDSVQITVRLLQARPEERHLWAETLQRDMRGVLGLQGDVARLVAERIQVAVTPDELRRLSHARAVSPEAYQTWLQAWAAMYRSNRLDVERCITLTERAAGIDTAYAAAYALAAFCHVNMAYMRPTPPADAFGKAKTAALRAVQLDPALGSAHMSLAMALAGRDWDWAGADREYRLAIDLSPSDAVPHWWYSFFLAGIGRHGEALEHARAAELLSPAEPGPGQNLAMVLYLARRNDEAIAQARRTIELTPEFLWTYHRLAQAYEGKKMYAEAVQAWEKTVALSNGRDANRRAYLARCYALAGRTADARRILSELLTLRKTEYVPSLAIALIYTGLGELDTAMDWLDEAYDARDGDMVLLKTWPALDPLRSHPRFQRLLARMNLPES